MVADYSTESEREHPWMTTDAESQGDKCKCHKLEQMIQAIGPLMTINTELQGDENKGHWRDQMLHAMGQLTSFRRLLEILLTLLK
jgi:hypothetical protein